VLVQVLVLVLVLVLVVRPLLCCTASDLRRCS